MDNRIERNPAEQPRRRIAQPIGSPRMRQFVKGEGKQQDGKRDENLREEVDVQRPNPFLRAERAQRRALTG
jgi:hypothetical protein